MPFKLIIIISFLAATTTSKSIPTSKPVLQENDSLDYEKIEHGIMKSEHDLPYDCKCTLYNFTKVEIAIKKNKHIKTENCVRLRNLIYAGRHCSRQEVTKVVDGKEKRIEAFAVKTYTGKLAHFENRVYCEYGLGDFMKISRSSLLQR